ncbi:5'-nucleotidase [Nocardia huaxiensis]|uniref:5'-nucleotidase n=1 Tax=Nocardia huaxiensis TaxID=2755382 RepID=A0A7D6YZB4_9NOCA|nr:5'-nucleotidase [Nocardia huaxiensis]QLY28146.1 5'-nucleotidase [Nocardia huaxiensis]UFS98407.1 5'-nucleotidase [Nocardia huaxiensis]
MAYSLDNRLVIGVASSALFDLREADAIFRTSGETVYRRYQEEHLDDPLAPGVAFEFIRRILLLNDLSPSPSDPLVEVVIMSRNDPDTGLRVMRSVAHHGLGITRAIFTAGSSPYEFIPALNISLYLSADDKAVRAAVDAGHPAGFVLDSTAANDAGEELRIAFDFDGVLTDDTAEQIYQSKDIVAFHASESAQVAQAHPDGLLLPFLKALSRIQQVERRRHDTTPGYRRRLSISIVTARNAPSHERMIRSLGQWKVQVDNAFFLGGIEKGRIMQVLRPHIFFDDQQAHLTGTSKYAPSVHVPFGRLNQRSEELAGTGDSES